MSTGTCLILITPDSERTMCTFLGTAGKIKESDIEEKIVKQSEVFFSKDIYGIKEIHKKHLIKQ